MTHPSEAELALYAGGDLGWWQQRLTERHVCRCGLCQASVSAFSELRSESNGFPASPALQWKRLESEMKANIRLGISAGECVSMHRPRLAASFPNMWRPGAFRPHAWRRLAVACAVLLGVAGIGYVVEHPPVGMVSPAADPGSVLEVSNNGLQVHEGSQTLRLLNTSGRDVSHSVGARGELGARYMDLNGNVTISQVYGQ
jgi:hypothetical protein